MTGYTSDEANDAGTYDNPYYIGGPSLAMAPPLSDGLVTYDDGTPETLDQYAKDISHFLMWAAEPKLEQRKSLGFKAMIFMIIFAGLLWHKTPYFREREALTNASIERFYRRSFGVPFLFQTIKSYHSLSMPLCAKLTPFCYAFGQFGLVGW